MSRHFNVSKQWAIFLFLVLLQCLTSLCSDVIDDVTSLESEQDRSRQFLIDFNYDVNTNINSAQHKVRHPSQHYYWRNVTSGGSKPPTFKRHIPSGGSKPPTLKRHTSEITDKLRYISAAGSGTTWKLKMSRSQQDVKLSQDITCEACVIDIESVAEKSPELLGLPDDYNSELWNREIESFYFNKSKSYLCMHANKTLYGYYVHERSDILPLNGTQRAECSWHAVHLNSTVNEDLIIYNFQHPLKHQQCRLDERKGIAGKKRCTKYAIDIIKKANKVKVRTLKTIGGVKNTKLTKWRQPSLRDHLVNDLFSPDKYSETRKHEGETKLTKSEERNRRTTVSVSRTSPRLKTRTGRPSKNISNINQAPTERTILIDKINEAVD